MKTVSKKIKAILQRVITTRQQVSYQKAHKSMAGLVFMVLGPVCYFLKKGSSERIEDPIGK